MKALEFRARLTQDRTLKIPPEIAAQVPLQQAVRVILLVPEEAEDQDWAKLTAKQFAKGYAPSDAIICKHPSHPHPHPLSPLRERGVQG